MNSKWNVAGFLKDSSCRRVTIGELLKEFEASQKSSFPNRDDTAAPIMRMLEGYECEQVLVLNLPYRTPLVRAGKFQWEILKEFSEEIRIDYEKDDVDIPLFAVIDKALELLEEFETDPRVTLDHAAAESQGKPSSSYIVTPGEFGGLFENFLEGERQETLNITSGATSLHCVMPIANKGTLENYLSSLADANSDRDVSKKLNELSVSLPDKVNHLAHPSTEDNHWRIGDALGSIVRAQGSEWVAKIVIFPRDLARKIYSEDPIGSEIKDQLITQLYTERRRIKTLLSISNAAVSKPSSESASILHHLFGVRMVASGSKLGLTPIIGTKTDNMLLPADEILALPTFSDLAKAKGKEGGFEVNYFNDWPFWILRPALQKENAIYFPLRPLLTPFRKQTKGMNLAKSVYGILESSKGWNLKGRKISQLRQVSSAAKVVESKQQDLKPGNRSYLDYCNDLAIAKGSKLSSKETPNKRDVLLHVNYAVLIESVKRDD